MDKMKNKDFLISVIIILSISHRSYSGHQNAIYKVQGTFISIIFKWFAPKQSGITSFKNAL